jgi:curved DNA-binding protein CbpA
VYRKLVSALHPDRASDDADRAMRTAQMKRVNRAYEAQDLLGLFALQLEIEQVDAAHLAQATAERARHYNQVLAAQLEDLQHELHMRQSHFVMDFGLDLGLDPYRRLQPQMLGKLIDRQVAQLRAELAEAERDLRQLDDPAVAKRWLKRVRRELASFDDELPF